MKKIISAFSVLVISLFVLAVFGWMSVHISKGDKDYGFLNEPVKFMYSFLDQFQESVKEVENLSATFLPIWQEFEPIKKLKTDFRILVSYSESNYYRSVVIRNLKNDSIEFKWEIPEKVERWDRVVNPIMFPNMDLVYFFTDKTGLRRIDSSGKVIWKQDQILAHHSLNQDSIGNLWVCSKNPPKESPGASYKMNGRTVYYFDDYISKIDPKNGELLFHKSVSEILKDNGLESYILQALTVQDPIHLNDVQPALKTTQFYNEGDVFLSVKQSSTIIHYRPESNTVIKMIEGPFSAQHDVDFFNDSTLTIFNNNANIWRANGSNNPPKDEVVEAADYYSNIVSYSFNDGSFKTVDESLFRENEIFTFTEGLHEYVNDSTYFIEEQNYGYLWVIQNDEVLYKDVFRSLKNGYCHLPNWARIIKE